MKLNASRTAAVVSVVIILATSFTITSSSWNSAGANKYKIAATKPHRGKIQAQGAKPPLEKSVKWELDEPLTAADGLAKLNILWDSLTVSEQKERKGAYDCAAKYIKNAAANGGLEAVDTRPKTCQEPTRKDPTARIDIEVNAGKAFVP